MIRSRMFVIVMMMVVTSTSAAAAATSASVLVGPLNTGFFFSPSNWHVTETLATAINPGAYFKLSFSGSTSVSLSVDATPCLWTACMTLAYSLDDEPMRLLVAPSNGPNGSPNITIPLANARNSTLSATTTHTLVLHIYNAIQFGNRWNDVGVKPYTDHRQALLLRGVILDVNATTSPPVVRRKRMIAYGDSITEGVNAACEGHGDLHANAATKTWVQPLAAAFNAEYGQVGFGRQGFTITGNGQVPPFFTPGVSVNSSWDKIYRGVQRSFVDIDYIFILHATNDGLNPTTCPVDGVVASCQGWLAAVRAVAGPITAVFLVVPFGGFGAKNAPVNALPTAFAAYQQATPDPKTFLIDLQGEAAQGLECGGWMKGCVAAYGTPSIGASEQGCDGIHPRGGTNTTARHGDLGAMVAVHAALALAGQPHLLM